MTNTASFHSSVIIGLGGKAKLAEALGLERNVLTKWHVRGIPAKHWHKVVEIAASLNPPQGISSDDLERTKPSANKDTP